MDVSGSLSDERLTLQRSGHARAVASDAFLDAVASGFHGRVALAAIEWTDRERQSLVVPWSVVETGADARQFATALLRASRPIPGYTSISGGIDFAVALLDRAPYAAMRRVIDVSGNGPNNDGRLASEARDDAVAAGATVNGLPMLDVVSDLAGYFAQNVIGGPGAFMVVAQDAGSFERAILRKLVLEVAHVPGEGPRDPIFAGSPMRPGS
ncbi:DUF1194 domain-containing protein [Neoroseomonas terrae]|nr:DUF1194 domain-containing protein [Neoroseomonas terrae]